MNYTYDLDSRLTQVTDPTGPYQFMFDFSFWRAPSRARTRRERLTAAKSSYSFLTARSLTTSYSYDAAPNSNSFVNQITQACGLTFSLPRLATGWNFQSKP